MIIKTRKVDEEDNKKKTEKVTDKEKKDIEDTEKKEEIKEPFLVRFKKDKKLRDKVELGFYAILIISIILYINIASFFNRDSGYTDNVIDDVPSDTDNISSDIDLYKELGNNYKANIEIEMVKEGVNNNLNYEIETDGVKTNIKKINNINQESYSLVDQEYYKNAEEVVRVDEAEIFDLVSYKYLDIKNIKNYISNGVAEYTTNYSNGNKLVSYNVFLKDILVEHNLEDFITINVTTDSQNVTLEIDYSSLLKNDSIDSCKVKIICSEIGKINLVDEG